MQRSHGQTRRVEAGPARPLFHNKICSLHLRADTQKQVRLFKIDVRHPCRDSLADHGSFWIWDNRAPTRQGSVDVFPQAMQHGQAPGALRDANSPALLPELYCIRAVLLQAEVIFHRLHCRFMAANNTPVPERRSITPINCRRTQCRTQIYGKYS